MSTSSQIIDTAQRKLQNKSAQELNTILRELFLLTGLAYTPINVLGVDFDLSGTPSNGDVLSWVTATNKVEFTTPPSGVTDLSKNTVADTQININSSTGTDISLISGTDLKTVNGVSIIGSGNIAVGGAANLSSVTVADTSIAINIDTGTDIQLLSGTDIKTVNSASLIGPGNLDFYIAPDQVGFMVWAEENAGINPATNSGFQFSYGNGANNNTGIKVPYAGVVTALTLQGDSNFVNADIELYVNGVGSGANITANAADNAQVTGLSIPVAAGDTVNFRTIAGSGGTRVVVGAFIEHINSVNFTPTGPEGRTPYPIEVAYNSGLF